jgi:hypothetical protein
MSARKEEVEALREASSLSSWRSIVARAAALTAVDRRSRVA